MALQLSIGARVRKSPFFDATRADGMVLPVFTITCICRLVMAIQLLNMSG